MTSVSAAIRPLSFQLSVTTLNAPPAVGPSQARWTEFDGLRFFAVLGVMAVHFAPGLLGALGPWGEWGVRFFFVLSGFLITQLLFRARDRACSGQSRARNELGIFFIRRALRLWPVYFLTLLVTALVNIEHGRAMLAWNALFVGNYFILFENQWPGLFSHLWTLAVEQQFYVIWPVLVLFGPPRSLPGIFILLAAIGPCFRIIEVIFAVGGLHVANILLPECVDFFAWGAAVALLAEQPPNITARLERLGMTFSVMAALGLLCGFHLGCSQNAALANAALAGTLTSMAAAGVLLHCLSGRDSTFRRFLRWPPFVYLGTISYGIYLLHNFAHWLGPRLLRRITGFNYFPWEIAHFLYLTALSILLAALSWHLLERPINDWRKTVATRPRPCP